MRPIRIVAWPAHSNADRNPYQDLLYTSIEAYQNAQVTEFNWRSLLSLRRIDILHSHWPDGFLAAGGRRAFWLRLLFLRVAVWIAKLRGARLVWTAHNVQRSHQRNSKLMTRWFWHWWVRNIDAVIFLSESSRIGAVEKLPGLNRTPYEVIPHGHYLPTMPLTVRKMLPATVTPRVIFFGSLTAYKNPSSLVRAASEVDPGSLVVRIAGSKSLNEPDLDLEPSLLSLPETARNLVDYTEEHLSDRDLFSEVSTSDLAVFPYDRVLNSGAALYALSAGCAILATRQPAFEELRDAVGSDFVRLYDGDLNGSLLASHARAARRLREDNQTPDLGRFSWDSIAFSTLRLYETVRKR